MSVSLREEFRLSKFGLNYPDPEVFVTSQWPIPAWMYLIWRTFWCLWHIGWIIASGVRTHDHHPEDSEKWFIYATNITLLLTTITCLIDFIIVLYIFFARKGSVLYNKDIVEKHSSVIVNSTTSADKEEILFQGSFVVEEGIKEFSSPWYLRLVWMLYNMIYSANLVVTVMFWAVEFDGWYDAVSIAVHAFNTVFAISNLLVSALPLRILHAIYPMLFGAIYFLFTAIYYAAGGTNIRDHRWIYEVLDWSDAFPTAVTVIVGLVFAVPLVHMVFFALFTFRVFLKSKCSCSRTGSFEVTSNWEERSERGRHFGEVNAAFEEEQGPMEMQNTGMHT